MISSGWKPMYEEKNCIRNETNFGNLIAKLRKMFQDKLSCWYDKRTDKYCQEIYWRMEGPENKMNVNELSQEQDYIHMDMIMKPMHSTSTIWWQKKWRTINQNLLED